MCGKDGGQLRSGLPRCARDSEAAATLRAIPAARDAAEPGKGGDKGWPVHSLWRAGHNYQEASSSTSPDITILGESVGVEAPISNSFILSNSMTGTDPDLLDLGVGLLVGQRAASFVPTLREPLWFSIPFGNARISLQQFDTGNGKKSSRNQPTIQDSSRNRSLQLSTELRGSLRLHAATAVRRASCKSPKEAALQFANQGGTS